MKKITLKRISLFLMNSIFKISSHINPMPRPSIEIVKQTMKKDIIVVEIGTFSGFNALAILNNLPVKKMYIIDPYENYTDNEEFHVNGDKILTEAKQRLKKHIDKIVFIRKYSEDAMGDIENADYIYIDGNHDYEFVKKDLELYYKKLKPGGILAGHDFDAGSTGVCKATIEFAEKNKLKLHAKVFSLDNNDWWLIKNE